MEGIRPGDSDRITREYMDSLLIEMRHLDGVMPDTRMTVYGRTFDTPIAFSESRVHSPIQPAPVTTAVCPKCAPPWFAACIPTARGSIKAPSMVLMLGGKGKHNAASWATYS